ncbi:MAG: hypothetical protein KDK70_16030, partial [Myxococcales bacterium]|nr:hypothetical protein [Myxococcales bacterium]
GQVVMLTGHSGPATGGSIPNHQNPGGQGTSRGGQRYNVKKAPGSSRAGNCAAPKMLEQARRQGLTPLAMTEAWHGPPPPSGAPYSHGEHAESCDTCKKLLPAMLCDQPPPAKK